LVAIGADRAKEALLDQLAMVLGGRPQRSEEHALAGQLAVQPLASSCYRRGAALAQYGGRLRDNLGGRGPVGLLKRPQGVETQRLEVDLPPLLVGLGVGQRGALEHLERLEAPETQPVRFGVEGAQLLHSRTREAHSFSRPTPSSRERSAG